MINNGEPTFSPQWFMNTINVVSFMTIHKSKGIGVSNCFVSIMQINLISKMPWRNLNCLVIKN